MKKILTLLSLLLCLQFSTIQAQQNIYVWKNGSYSVMSTSDVDSITFAAPTSGSVTVNGHEFVDLGLPSGLKWATCNVGASSPSEDGDYFAWGETDSKSDYSWDTYKWGDGSTFTKYTSSGKTTLDPEDDAATQNWGEGCRMPTVDEFEELLNNTNNERTTINGVKGRKFTSKKSSAFVFFPASGHRNGGDLYDHGSYGDYWSSSLHLGDGKYAYHLNFYISSNCSMYSDYCYFGRTVRAVCP